jgi:hypothetical protein
MKEHQLFWDDHSYAQPKPSSMQSMPRLSFFIKDKKEKFLFKERILHSPALPQKAFMPKKPATPVPKKKNFRN